MANGLSLRVAFLSSRRLLLTAQTKQCVSVSTACRQSCLLGSSYGSSRRLHSDAKHPTDQDFFDLLGEENKTRAIQNLLKVKPARRLENDKLKKTSRFSAVLVPLCIVNNEPSLLFTLRSRQLRAHRGDVSFPGGAVDKTDRDLAHTALRETNEELGIDPSIWDVWGQMQPIPSADQGQVAYPILASTGDLDPSNLSINPNEVEEAFTVSLSHLCHLSNVGSTQFRSLNGYTLPVYHAKYRIWGLTAIVVHMTLNVLAPHLYHFKLKHRGTYSPPKRK